MKRQSLILISGLCLLISPAIAIIDSNENGLSDLWEKQHNDDELFPETFDAQADPDQDGWTNAEEAAAGTDPLDPNPPGGFLRPEILHTPAVIGEENGQPVIITPEAVTVSWPTLVGKQYTLQFSPDLSENWITIDQPLIGDGDTEQYSFLTATAPSNFYRIAVTDTDSDGDDLTNAEEHALGTDPNSTDTDSDGLGDLEEVKGDTDPKLADSDADGIPDKSDVKTEPTKILNWPKEEPVLYAAFPAPVPGTILQVNDQGFILTSDALWKNGVSTPLAESNGTLLRNCQPMSLGDNGFILGTGEIDLPNDDGEQLSYCHVTWRATPPSTDLIPEPLTAGENYLYPLYLIFNGHPPAAVTLSPSDLTVNRHGQFIAVKAEVKTTESTNETFRYLSPLPNTATPASCLFAGASANPSVTYLSDVADRSIFAVGDQEHVVGVGADRRLKLGQHTFPAGYNRIVQFDDTRLIALSGYENIALFSGAQDLRPLVLSNGTWTEVHALGLAKDHSKNLKLTTQMDWLLFHNGYSEDGWKMYPNQQPDWQTAGEKRFADITSRGIVLQTKEENGQLTAMMGIPLRLLTGGEAMGVDNLSVTGRSPSNATADMLAGNKKEFWLMVPAGDSLTFDLESGASAETPLSIDSVLGLDFLPSSVSSGNATLTVSAAAGLAGQEHDAQLKVGNVPNASVPLKVKVMKRRNVIVAVYPLRRPSATGNPPTLPSQAEIETYLDGIFKKQIGVDFAVTVHPVATLTNDPGMPFYVEEPPLQHQRDIAVTRTEGNIQLFVLLDYKDMKPKSGVFEAVGWANPASNFAWLGIAELVASPPEPESWLNTCAHEVGHILFGPGHPNVESSPGRACLPLSNRSIRLMATGAFGGAPASGRRWTVKAEWDAAESKLVELLKEGS